MGVVLGSLAGVVLVSLPSNIRALARETDTSAKAVVKSLIPLFWRFSVLALFGAIVIRWVPGSFVGLVATSVGALAVYSLMMMPVLMRPPLAEYVRQRLPSFFARSQPVRAYGVDSEFGHVPSSTT